MNIHVNKGCGCGCDGSEVPTHRNMRVEPLKANTATQRQQHAGKEHLVVPLVMLRETVVNGGLVTLSELKPMGWNGVPVTIGHPANERGANVSASQNPQIHEQVKVGTIFGAHVDGDKLKAQAWIDIELAEARYKGIISILESGVPMDVSVGYYSTDEQRLGVFNDKPYFEVHKDLKPDHLAILPDEEGACSWADGCGVRANSKDASMPKDQHTHSSEELTGVSRFIQALLPHLNRRGNDDDYRQMVADLISNDATPFVPDDEFSLRELTRESLQNLRDTYIPKANSQTKEGGHQMAGDKKPEGTPQMKSLTADDVKKIVVDAMAETLPDLIKAQVEQHVDADKRAALVEAIHGDMGLDKEELAKLSTQALQTMAAKSPASKKADFSGRGINVNAADSVHKDGDQKKYAAMADPHAHVKKKEA